MIGFAEPLTAPEAARQVAERGAMLFAMELVPRITRAQSMDALSSMATIAGYKAVLLAAERRCRGCFRCSTPPPARSPPRACSSSAPASPACRRSRRRGASAPASRRTTSGPAVKEQIQSLGARFVEMPLEAGDAQDTGGYAKAQDESFYRRQREMMMKTVATTDVVITTAAIPGKRAPILVTDGDGEGDAARIGHRRSRRRARRQLRADARRTRKSSRHGVTILGPTNITSTVPYHASQMYARNVVTLVQHLVQREKGADGKATGAPKLRIDMDDEITQGDSRHPRRRRRASARARAASGST